MNNTSPFSFLQSIASRFQPPAWVVDETQQRLVLFLNHVLMQEKAAQERLLRQKGRIVHVQWGVFAIDLIVTPAGLADRAPADAKPDLVLSVTTESPLAVVQAALAGKPPAVKIEGDVQLAAELGWLAENLRWDVEEDLSRLIGDAPAHTLASVGRRVAAALKEFLARGPLSGAFPAPTDAAAPSPERSNPAAAARKPAERDSTLEHTQNSAAGTADSGYAGSPDATGKPAPPVSGTAA
ncbi:MAG: ubiquinone biosynthesis accessory factor UbiJ [Polaromonas sp.]